MKGVIIKATEKLVISKTDIETWEDILVETGFERDKLFLIRDDVDDKLTLKLFKVTSKVLGMSTSELFEIFGDYWVNSFTSDIYAQFYDNIKTGKEFLLKLNAMHRSVKEMMEGSQPPQVEYDEPDENTIITTYKSERGLVDLFIGMAMAVFTKYQENVSVEKLNDNRVKFTWI